MGYIIFFMAILGSRALPESTVGKLRQLIQAVDETVD